MAGTDLCLSFAVEQIRPISDYVTYKQSRGQRWYFFFKHDSLIKAGAGFLVANKNNSVSGVY